MVRELFLIRHGQTEGSETLRYKGSIDVPLSEEGVRQMEKTARFIAGTSKTISAIYTSNLQRARRSAEIIVEIAAGAPPIIVPDLMERNFGIWEGMSFDEIMQRYPEEFGLWAADPLRFSPPEGETTIEVRDRAIRALDEVLRRHTARGGDAAIIVAHGGINRIILCHFMGIPLENIFRVEQDYGAVSIIELHDDYPVLRLANYRP